MSMQIFKPLALLSMFALAACTSNEDNERNLAAAEKEAEVAAQSDGKVECALAGAKTYARTCQTERIKSEKEEMLVIRHADGGFRRFKVLQDGRGLAPADGFDVPKISIVDDGLIEVASGGDRYLLPAMVKKKAPTEITAPVDGAPKVPAQ